MFEQLLSLSCSVLFISDEVYLCRPQIHVLPLCTSSDSFNYSLLLLCLPFPE